MGLRATGALLALVLIGAACSDSEQLQSGTIQETSSDEVVAAPDASQDEPSEDDEDPKNNEDSTTTGTDEVSEDTDDVSNNTDEVSNNTDEVSEDTDEDSNNNTDGVDEETEDDTEADPDEDADTNSDDANSDDADESDDSDDSDEGQDEDSSVSNVALKISQRGDSGDHVLALQERLAELGFAPGTPDGSYGKRTSKAVAAFQGLLGLDETGIANARTLAALAVYEYDGLLLKAGDEGDIVEALQKQLGDGPFDPGPIDGVYGTGTTQAVWALEKMAGIPVDGDWGPLDEQAWEQLLAGQIGLPENTHDMRWVEVDLSQQIMKVYDPDSPTPVLISHASSGSGVPWENEDHSGSSVTPIGDFHINRRINGWRESSLNIGRLYNPLYFNGGIAFHGANSVPLYPASHGCIRLPMHVADYLPGELPNGTPVHILR